MALTPKQQRFVDEYLVDLNGAAAYRRAGYAAKTDKVASAGAARLLANVSIAAAVAAAQGERKKRLELSQDTVVENLLCEAQYRGEGASHSARVTAWVHLGKHLGMWPNKLNVESNLTARLTLEQALTADRELETWLKARKRS